MKTNYEQIVQTDNIGKRVKTDYNSLIELASKEKFEPAARDAKRRLLLCIDVQNDFVEGGSLAVSGAAKDIERLTQFIYNNMGGITRIMGSLDTHIPHQIFFPCWWKNPEGENPDPYTIITYDDVEKDKFRPIIGNPQDSIEYLQGLEAAGKKKLCIWPYHCIQGTDGIGLENEFAKMVYFHSVARSTANRMIPKGEDPYSEMYGILYPEFNRKNYINTPVVTAMTKYNEIYIAGEAASHCLLESVRQIGETFKDRPEITQKITILKDCTSPIQGYEDETTQTFAEFERNFGMKFANSTDIQF